LRYYARFRSLRKLSDRYSSWMKHMTKDILTTKIMKATKSGGFETRPYIFLRPLRSLRLHYFFLRALRALRG